MNCSACGADNREGARFCRSCGASLPQDEEQAALQGEDIAAKEEADETESPAAAPSLDAPGKGLSGEIQPQGAVPDETASEQALSVEASPPLVAPPPSVVPAPAVPAPEGAVVGAESVETTLDVPGSAQGEEGETVLEAEVESEQEGGDASPPEEDAVEPAEGGVAEPAVAEPQEEFPVPSPAAGNGETAEDGPLIDDEDDVFSFWRDEPDLMEPVELGTVVANRFAVIEALDVQESEILYHARDLQRCWQCGHDANDPEGAFCARCGVLMDRRPEVRLLEIQDGAAEPDTGRVVVARLSHNARKFLVLAEPEPEPEPEPEQPPQPQTTRLLVGQRSDAGQIRELDEDSLFALTMAPTFESRTGPVLGLFAVADGMGGHASGELASRTALQVLVDHVMRNIIMPEIAGELILEDEILALLRQATMAANDAVYLARQKRESDMGTTLTTVMVRDNRLFVAHVGDCRAYRYNADGLEQLTTDHSVVANMIAEGQIEPEEIYTHPHRSIIYRCIGDKPVVEVDTNMLPLLPGDRIILCCDGLWEMIHGEGIKDVLMQEADSQAASDLLVQHANAAGGEDNISVIVVQVEAVNEVAAE